MPFARFIVALVFSSLAFAAPTAALDKVTLATNWKAQPELGGFYQAVADGTYRKYGLDVTIKPGGPQIHNRPLLAAGRVDFLVGTNLLQAFDAVKQGVPTRVVAAIFQKDPQCLIAHPGQGYDEWQDLTRAPLLMANSGRDLCRIRASPNPHWPCNAQILDRRRCTYRHHYWLSLASRAPHGLATALAELG